MDKIRAFGITLCAGIIVAVSFWLGLFQGLEFFFEDLLVRPKPASADVVVIAIDDASLQKIGQWPWPREIFARTLAVLNNNPPAVVGVDIMLSEPSGRGAADDAALRTVLAGITYPVVFPAEASPLVLSETDKAPRAENLLTPLALFIDNIERVSLGHANFILDPDGIVRKFPLLIATQYPSARPGVLAAFGYEILKQGGYAIPDEKKLDAIPRIAYSALPGSIRKISFSRLLDGGEETGTMLRDKIVLIGVTAPDLHDTKLTPFSRGTEMPGVELQAQIVTMLQSGYRLVPLAPFLAYLWILAAALLPALFFFLWPRSLKPLAASVAAGVAYMVAIAVLFENGIVVNMLHTHFAWLLSTSALFAYRYLSGERERKEIKKLFGKYVSPRVLEEILVDPAKVALGGEEREVTVLFSDIRGFTTLSEKTSPQELVRILNKYFSAMSAEIVNREAVLDKYIGDAIMAFWGAPLDDPLQADHALAAAKGMIAALKKLNEELAAAGDPEIAIGIGIHTGRAVVGNIGSEFRFDYTLIGDTVNVASRLEGLNKEHKTTLIISENTKNKLREPHELRSLGEVSVKGRAEPLHVYTLL
ncbi:MAG: adenylate/guanylate cyclase domain-containing protein [Candidatus Sungbacteria bacterium]|nr:adenylate/guanylate cyclase domain-containing protein [Candidatus Sungbacteria bacterium]